MASTEVASATTYLPGSLFRYYKEDGTHYTAVLLKDGRVLEVKNPETKEKTKFASLAEWKEIRGFAEDKIQLDTERTTTNSANGGTGDSSLKMKYPRNSKKINCQLRWYYDMMKECNPAMLDNEEIIKAYNALVDVCHKYYDDLYPSYMYSRKCYKYLYDLFMYTGQSQWNKWAGFQACFPCENDYYGAKKTNINFDVAREEILACYKTFYDLVHKDLHSYMEKKEKERSTLKRIERYKAYIAKIERSIQKATSRYEVSLTYYKNELKKLEKS